MILVNLKLLPLFWSLHAQTISKFLQDGFTLSSLKLAIRINSIDNLFKVSIEFIEKLG